MFCASCGTQNASGAFFCAKCGAQLVSLPPPPQPEQPAVHEPKPPYTGSYSKSRPEGFTYGSGRSYRGGASPISWLSFVGCIAAIVGMFAPMTAGAPVSERTPSFFNLIKRVFEPGSAAGEKWVLLYPSAFVLMAVLLVLLGINGLGKRAGWLGLVVVMSSAAAIFSLTIFLAMKSDGTAYGAGILVPLISAASILLLTLVQLFVESD